MLSDLRKSEWDKEYEELRRNRMLMGAFRYSKLKEQDHLSYDFIAEARRRICLFNEDDNLEHLVDAGNMIMLAFRKWKKCGLTVKSIDDGVHNKKLE